MTESVSPMAGLPETLSWQGGRPGHVRMIEQTLLPGEFTEIDVETVDQMVDAIYRLAVRGAPADALAGSRPGSQAGWLLVYLVHCPGAVPVPLGRRRRWCRW